MALKLSLFNIETFLLTVLLHARCVLNPQQGLKSSALFQEHTSLVRGSNTV
jgi:hypothetical protein